VEGCGPSQPLPAVNRAHFTAPTERTPSRGSAGHGLDCFRAESCSPLGERMAVPHHFIPLLLGCLSASLKMVRNVTNEQRPRQPLSKPTLWAVASWLIFYPAAARRLPDRHPVRIPHQFLLNDIESIFPGPLKTGAGCGLRCCSHAHHSLLGNARLGPIGADLRAARREQPPCARRDCLRAVPFFSFPGLDGLRQPAVV
jgi:hypothetical protein